MCSETLFITTVCPVRSPDTSTFSTEISNTWAVGAPSTASGGTIPAIVMLKGRRPQSRVVGYPLSEGRAPLCCLEVMISEATVCRVVGRLSRRIKRRIGQQNEMGIHT